MISRREHEQPSRPRDTPFNRDPGKSIITVTTIITKVRELSLHIVLRITRRLSRSVNARERRVRRPKVDRFDRLRRTGAVIGTRSPRPSLRSIRVPKLLDTSWPITDNSPTPPANANPRRSKLAVFFFFFIPGKILLWLRSD